MSVKRDNMSFSNILLFTDLDGTLLNKKTFEFKAALNLIKNCISKGINIIPNSSKTDLELNEICEDLKIPKVYISENGSCIYGLNFLSENLNEKICLSRNKDIIFKNFTDKINVKLQKIKIQTQREVRSHVDEEIEHLKFQMRQQITEMREQIPQSRLAGSII